MDNSNEIGLTTQDLILPPEKNVTFFCHVRTWLENEKQLRLCYSLFLFGMLTLCTAALILFSASIIHPTGALNELLKQMFFLLLAGGTIVTASSISSSVYYLVQARPLRERLVSTMKIVGEGACSLPAGEELLPNEISGLKKRNHIFNILLGYSFFFLLSLIVVSHALPLWTPAGQFAVFALGSLILGFFIFPCHYLHNRLCGGLETLDSVEEKLPAVAIVEDNRLHEEAHALSELRRQSAIYWRTRLMAYIPLLGLFATLLVSTASVLFSIVFQTTPFPLLLNLSPILLLFSLFFVFVHLFARAMVQPIIWLLRWKMDRSQDRVGNIFDARLHPEHDVIETLRSVQEPTFFKSHSSKLNFLAIMSVFTNLMAIWHFKQFLGVGNSHIPYLALGTALSFWVYLKLSNYLEDRNALCAKDMAERLSFQKNNEKDYKTLTN